MYSTRHYMIFPTSELSKINFTQVLETSQNTVRKSVNQLKTFVTWVDTQPSCISTLLSTEGPYTHDEIVIILSTSEWTPTITW